MNVIPSEMKLTDRTEEEQLHFFDECFDCYKEAEAISGRRCFYYNIADTIICLSFAGESLIPILTRALSHLQIPEDRSPDMTIHIWDSETSGVEMADAPCHRMDFTDRGDIWGFNSKRIKTAFHWSEFSVNVMDLDRSTAVYWVRKPEDLEYWVASSPLRTILHWWMEVNGCQLMHAAAVGADEGAILITGRGGAGKSTTAVSCLLNGMYYLGDDYVIVKKDPVPKVYSLYSTAKIEVKDHHKFPSLKPLAAIHTDQNQPKDLYYLYPAFVDQIKKEKTIKAIVTPRIDTENRETTFAPVSYWHINRATSFTTMSQLPGVGKHTHDYFKALCDAVPTLTLVPGRDLNEVPKVIRSYLKNPVPYAAYQGSAYKKDLPLVSVVIPVFNGAKFIEGAIENVLGQHYPALEIIVINDGSTDDIDQIMSGMETDIRYIRRNNAGPAAARNEGIKDASGKYIAFLDVDDLWPENNLVQLVDDLERNEYLDIVRGRAQLFRDGENGEMEFLGNPGESFAWYIGSGLYRASVFSNVGLFDPLLQYGEDTDWFYRATENRVTINELDEVTLYVRRHGKNMTEGRGLVELNNLKTIKKALDRRRAL